MKANRSTDSIGDRCSVGGHVTAILRHFGFRMNHFLPDQESEVKSPLEFVESGECLDRIRPRDCI